MKTISQVLNNQNQNTEQIIWTTGICQYVYKRNCCDSIPTVETSANGNPVAVDLANGECMKCWDMSTDILYPEDRYGVYKEKVYMDQDPVLSAEMAK